MSITIIPDVQGSPKKKRWDSGFTIPEVLISICICLLLLQSVWQWTILTERSNERMLQNQQAVLLAQSALANAISEMPEGWELEAQEESVGPLLTAKQIRISYDKQQWDFYYAGFAEDGR